MPHLVAIGGSDAGISAALRARQLDPSTDVTVVLADAYPNYSICGIPYYLSGETPDWRQLAHRTAADLEAAGIELLTDTTVTEIDVERSALLTSGPGEREQVLPYDTLVVGTGAVPVRPPITGLDTLGAADGVHLLHSIGDARAVMATLTAQPTPRTAVIVGAGYIGLELAEALTTRGLHVTQIEALPEVLPTLDPELGAHVHHELASNGVEVLTGTSVTAISRGDQARLRVEAQANRPDQEPVALTRDADLVVVVVGVRPDTTLLAAAGAQLGARGAVLVDEHMRTGLPGVYAAGDCVVTHHQLLGLTWLPLGTTAHKQGRIAGENAVGGDRGFAGSLGTQVVKVFDLVAARTGLRDVEAGPAGWTPTTTATAADDHKAYYPGATTIHTRLTGATGHRDPGRLLGAQLIGRHGAEIAKRIDIYATALHHRMTIEALNDLDLAYTPPLGSPWDPVQLAAQAWTAGPGRDLAASV